MGDREQQRRERAYKIWEDEGRPEGAHEEHWRRAEEQGELSEQQSEDVTKVNQKADNVFKKDGKTAQSASDIRPPSTISPD
ncbi:DUF2934 domain-containing protein [Shinella sp. CPCC 101442]|uniref:DUF2934 domain-containing protein n=1 Tax=Shinella kummerowiae TaxID=417745 RepID=A0A6N8SAZ3_9HYPH|nr:MULTISPECIES: DUF2934 domain-containing protein [Shinella]MCR6502485.1 DUF2934 domain-containing protein [Shinella sp. CPCC 101442]MXN44132.1 DUF2934 domain-containing protein [Shinella kummerowiae]